MAVERCPTAVRLVPLAGLELNSFLSDRYSDPFGYRWGAATPPVSPENLMRLAIDAARAGIAVGQSPFGCAIALGDTVLACERNAVLETTDITAHAEINALRTACRSSGGIFLTGAAVATTCEPCPMCMAALHWARVDTVYYGASISDAADGGFNELALSAADVVRLGNSPVRLVPGTLAEDCRRLFDLWKQTPGTQAY